MADLGLGARNEDDGGWFRSRLDLQPSRGFDLEVDRGGAVGACEGESSRTKVTSWPNDTADNRKPAACQARTWGRLPLHQARWFDADGGSSPTMSVSWSQVRRQVFPCGGEIVGQGAPARHVSMSQTCVRSRRAGRSTVASRSRTAPRPPRALRRRPTCSDSSARTGARH